MSLLADELLTGPVAAEQPTIWGLDPMTLHDHYWASRGVQVVRAGCPTAIDPDVELFLLIDPRCLVLFDLQSWVSLLHWTKPDLLMLRVHAQLDLGYRERVVANETGDFVRFERRYKAKHILATRVGLTCDGELAEAWASAAGTSDGWMQLRRAIPSTYRETRSARGRIYRRALDQELGRLVEDLISIWNHPVRPSPEPASFDPKAWVDPVASVHKNARMIGPVWVGAGRQVSADEVIVGPAILWDDPAKRPEPEQIRWADIEPSSLGDRMHLRPKLTMRYRTLKRAFDIVFSAAALLLTLPFYPLIMLAIFWEDGLPFFFCHKRETLEGRVFKCIKFRSMRKDADQIGAELAAQNQADGPQFFIEQDPRVTRVGRFMRKTHLDELPQFINVLLRHMSVVGPRPSPRVENQYCPEWRDARLSVRPGITGLWQVRRTRLRGRDFQEWIKYDIQYVENMSFALDLKLVWQTVVVIVRRAVRP